MRLVIALTLLTLGPSSILVFEPAIAEPTTMLWGPQVNYEGKFLTPFGIAADNLGNVYVTDSTAENVQKFSSNGTFVHLIGGQGREQGQFYMPTGVATDPNTGDVYVAEYSEGRIQKFTPDGEFISEWGKTDGYSAADGLLSNPMGIATDSDGNVLVADTGNNRIQKFSSNGTFIKKWDILGPNQTSITNPSAVSVDPDGKILVIDGGNQRLQKFTGEGVLIYAWNLTEFVAPAQQVQDSVIPLYAFGIATDSDGFAYVTTSNSTILKVGPTGDLNDIWQIPRNNGVFPNWPVGIMVNPLNNYINIAGYGESQIQVLSADGNSLFSWGSRADTGNQLTPMGMEFDSNDNVYVLDSNPARVRVFSPDGIQIRYWNVSTFGNEYGYYSTPNAIAVDKKSDAVYVVDDQYHVLQYNLDGGLDGLWNMTEVSMEQPGTSHLLKVAADSGSVYAIELGSNMVKKFSSDGNLTLQWNLLTEQEMEMDGIFNPTGIDVDSAGNVYIADYSRGSIKKFDSSGTPILQWGTRVLVDGQFFSPYDVAIDPRSNNVFVADNDNHRIQVFSSDGEFVSKWGTEGTGEGQFVDPTSIEVDSQGDIYVIDSGVAGRIQKFASDSIFVTGAGNHAPVADAGADQIVNENSIVALDGSKTADADAFVGDLEVKERVSVAWRQVEGPVVMLSNADSRQPHFVAPFVDHNVTLVFELVATDYIGAEDSDSVEITIFPGGSSTLLVGEIANLSDGRRSSTGELQVATSGNHVYLVWTEQNAESYDIMFRKSSDNGTSFEDPVTIRNTADPIGFREMQVSGENVYLTWYQFNIENGTSAIMFSASHNFGASFEDPIIIENDAQASDPKMAASADADNVYILWKGGYTDSGSKLFMKASNDSGTSFGERIDVSRNETGGYGIPAAVALGNNVYIGWNEGGSDGRAFFTHSMDSGLSLGPVTILADRGSIAEIGVSADPGLINFLIQHMEYVPIGAGGSASINHMSLFTSTDAGRSIDRKVLLTNNTAETQTWYTEIDLVNELDGDIYIKWTENQSDDRRQVIRVLSSHDGGSSFVDSIVADLPTIALQLPEESGGVIGDTENSPKMVVSDNVVHLVYQAAVNDGGDIHVFYTTSLDGGVSFAKRTRIFEAAGQFELSPRIAAADDGRIHIAWFGGEFDRENPLESLNHADAFYLTPEVVHVAPEFPSILAITVALSAALASARIISRSGTEKS
jgi:tripartite motif-containing protein 71